MFALLIWPTVDVHTNNIYSWWDGRMTYVASFWNAFRGCSEIDRVAAVRLLTIPLTVRERELLWIDYRTIGSLRLVALSRFTCYYWRQQAPLTRFGLSRSGDIYRVR